MAVRATSLAFLMLLFVAAPASAAPYGFSSAPTEQLAEPGWPVSLEVLPDGSVRTGFWELRFRSGGQQLKIGARTWDAGYLPVLHGKGCAGAACVTATYAYEQVAGTPSLLVRLEVRGRSQNMTRVRIAAELADTFSTATASGVFAQAAHNRYPAPVADSGIDGLYKQPGQTFSATAVQTTAGQALRRDGKTLLVAQSGTVAAHKAAKASSVAGDVTWSGRLRSRSRKAITLVLPLAPPAASTGFESRLAHASVAAAIASVKRRWRSRLAPVLARVSVPERKARDALLAGVVTMLQSRMPAADGSGAWVQHVNALQYRAFWLRDNALITGALGRLGLDTAVREDLAFIKAWQAPTGQLVSRTGQLDGTGQGLWALGEYARHTRDATWAAQQLATVRRAVAWVAAARATDPLGLLPKGDPRDNEFASGHLTGDDAWTVSGLRAAADLATIAGDGVLAIEATTQADQLAAALRAAALAASRRTADGAVPSSLDPAVRSGALDGGSEGYDWGNYMLEWPEALAPDDPLVVATIRRAMRRNAEGLVLWHGNLHTYVGFGVWMAQLRNGDQARAINGYYAMLTHSNSTHGSFETGVAPFKGRATQNNIAPHGAFAADLTMLTLAMLVDDRPDAVYLGSAVPPDWVRAGRTTRIGPVATRQGAVTLRIKGTSKGAKLTWTAPAGTRIVLRRPPWARGEASRVVIGPGTARWSWKRSPPKISFETEARALQAAYRRHHAQPPAGVP